MSGCRNQSVEKQRNGADEQNGTGNGHRGANRSLIGGSPIIM